MFSKNKFSFHSVVYEVEPRVFMVLDINFGPSQKKRCKGLTGPGSSSVECVRANLSKADRLLQRLDHRRMESYGGYVFI